MKKLLVFLGLVLAAAALPAMAMAQAQECMKFDGNWHGVWKPPTGEQWLYVKVAKSNCNAAYARTSSEGATKHFMLAKIVGGEMTLPCGSQGSCVFTVHGDDMWARYTGPYGNQAVFSRIKKK